VVVGAGIVGLATARELLVRRPGAHVAILEKEPAPGLHQTGRNSGVIHSGVYYEPGSLKARLCREGRARLLGFCDEYRIPYALTGKLIVAVRESERQTLAEISERGRANGVDGLELVGRDKIASHEPHATGLAALWVPTAGVVDYRQVAAALATDIAKRGGEVLLRRAVEAIHRVNGSLVIETSADRIEARRVIACAGLQSDRVAAMTGHAALRIVPFRGEYRALRPEARHLVRSMICPVPDPRFPFLGVHFTRHLDGEVWTGPNALLSLGRETYDRSSGPARDLWDSLTWPGVWKVVARYWRTGAAELWRSALLPAYVAELRRYVPAVRAEDLLPAPCGIRAQAVGRDGTLLYDFVIREEGEVLHLLNAPSPAATAAFAIAREIVDRSEQLWVDR
jgi:L-2-hydroxyglutarate oxidase LhgO